ncbi:MULTISPECIES: glycosyltransferase [Mycobacteriaceae]|uniref:glycosyltransferase n=1 Tax=Mycobacteriaceae TaxID=1762 RepID=UPI0007FE685F|nr:MULTISPECIES: glycosyltransferase [Mycobacteriaceae]MCK0173988.1 glycosyltransferase [Mycolicibacterium sp. F2034L]OBB55749.1 glycosyl transferase family 1 [Mycobacterium sp. 852013-51886_SCH5428379]
MKVVLASWGSRGEVEPLAAVGRELTHRGHDVLMAVPPDMVGFTESAGLEVVEYGPEWHPFSDAYRDYWTFFFRNPWRIQKLGQMWREVSDPLLRSRPQVSATLSSLLQDADLLLTGMNFEETAANVAECLDVPLATLHWFPLRANGQLVPLLPAPLGRRLMTVLEWLSWRGAKRTEDTQRRELGLPKVNRPWQTRIAGRGSLELQAYDEVCFPGLAGEWAQWNAQRPAKRPFIGTLALELTTDADEDVLSWIAAGPPPIFFGFGSMPLKSPSATVAMIASTCARLGERALIGTAGADFSDVPQFENVKVVGLVNFAAVFPVCRAVVHHGGAGTTAASLRAGVPILILSTDFNQALWGAQIKKLGVGLTRRFTSCTEKSLAEDLRRLLSPEFIGPAQRVASQMTKPHESAVVAADLIEEYVNHARMCPP